MSCIFCDIVDKKVPADIVYESDSVLAFNDISPQAPVHAVFIPKRHTENLLGLSPTDFDPIFSAINAYIKKCNLDEKGVRIVNNMGEKGGQTVFHVHFHLLSGRQMTWPPG